MMGLLQIKDQPALIQSIFAGAIDEIKFILDTQPNVNFLDCEKRSPLHAAAFKGDSEIVSLLISYGARVNAKDSKWITALHRACHVNADRVVDILLHNEAAVNARDRQWLTPLHVAVANDSVACVELLLDHVPSVNGTDRNGRTALHHAAVNGYTHLVDLLVVSGAVLNAADKRDYRPLHFAVQENHIDTVEVLINHGADVNAKDRIQCTPLHMAAGSGRSSMCRLLLSAGADVDASTSYGDTPLHLACRLSHISACQELVAFNANLQAVNSMGRTALHIAAASSSGVDCLMYLIRLGVDINKCSDDGRTPLHMTAIHGRFTKSKALIDEGAIIDCKDKNNCTPLHIAAQNGHDVLTTTLLSFGANPMEKGPEGRTPLHMSCLGGYVECCRKFLQAGVNLDAVDDTGKTPMHCAAYKGSAECLDILISNGASVHVVDHLNRTPLHYAALRGHYQCVFTLVGCGSPVNARDAQGCTPLHLAAAYDTESRCVQYLLEHRADPLMVDARGRVPLHYAVSGNNMDAVTLLVMRGREVFHVVEGQSDVTPLHLAAKHGYVEILQSILGYYRNVNPSTERGNTPLLLAARGGHTKCVQMLLRQGAGVGICESVHGMSSVHYSAMGGHSQCLSLLLDNSDCEAVVDMLDNYKRTALMLAVSGNHVECVGILLRNGANPNIFDQDMHSSLFRAVVNGQDSIVNMLLEHGAAINNCEIHGKTVIHLAAVCGHLTCLKNLLEKVADEDILIMDNQRCSALHWACYTAQWKCLECLLERKVYKSLDGNEFSPVHCAAYSGSEMCLDLLVKEFGTQVIHLRDKRQRTPLHIAALHGHAPCAKYLIEKGAQLEIKDEDGRTPLLAAAQFGQSQVVELLLSYKVNETATDKQGNTALHWACLKKHTFTASLLLEHSSEMSIVNITNKELKTPLHLSAKHGLVEVTRELLRRGASVLALDKEGFTPALCCASDNKVAQCLALILQNLTDLAVSNCKDSVSDSPSLKTFFDLACKVSLPGSLQSSKTQTSQTDLILVHESDLFQIRQIFKMEGKSSSSKKLDKKAMSSKRDNHRKLDCDMLEILKDEDVFIIEKEDFIEGYVPEPKNRPHGLNLHKSYSDISIACKGSNSSCCSTALFRHCSPNKMVSDVLEKKKNCRECYRLQHKCTDCTMRYLLRLHLQGKTSFKSFNDFIVKSLKETSPTNREKFLNAVDEVRREYSRKNCGPSERKISQKKIDRPKSGETTGQFIKNPKHTRNCPPTPEMLEQLLGSSPGEHQSFVTNVENAQSFDAPIQNATEKYVASFLERAIDESIRISNRDCVFKNSNKEILESLGEVSKDVSSNSSTVFEVETKNNTEKKVAESKGDLNEESKLNSGDNCTKQNFSLNEEFLKYLKSVKLGYDKTRDEEYFKALSSYMSYMLQKFDRDFELQKELERNYKSCAKYQEINKTLPGAVIFKKTKKKLDTIEGHSRKSQLTPQKRKYEERQSDLCQRTAVTQDIKENIITLGLNSNNHRKILSFNAYENLPIRNTISSTEVRTETSNNSSDNEFY